MTPTSRKRSLPTARPSAASRRRGDSAEQPLENAASPLRRAVERVGDRWVLLIVGVLLDGPRRFGELRSELGVAPNILTHRLRQLESDGVIVAIPYSQRPLRLSYELTASGRELASALSLLADWGARREGRTPDAFHETCGSPLETKLWCPTCERAVDDTEIPGTYDV